MAMKTPDRPANPVAATTGSQEADSLDAQRKELPLDELCDYTFEPELQAVREAIHAAGPDAVNASPVLRQTLVVVDAVIDRYARHPNAESHVIMAVDEMCLVADCIELLRHRPECHEALDELFTTGFEDARIIRLTGKSSDELFEERSAGAVRKDERAKANPKS